MIGFDVPLLVILAALVVIGAFVGRILNKCVLCFPRHERLGDQLKSVFPSQPVCVRCSAKPSGLDHIPIVGWILSKGRCPSCCSRLPLEMPFVEILTAALFAGVYWFEVPVGVDAVIHDTGLTSPEGPGGPELAAVWSPVVWFHARYLLHMLMICGLIVATCIDRRYRIIPDGSTLPVMVVAILVSGIFGQLFLVPIWFQDASTVRFLHPEMPEFLKPVFVPWDASSFVRQFPHLHGLLVSLLGALAGAGSVWSVRFIGSMVLKKEAMGLGDVVLMGMIGSVIGWQPVLAVFIFAPMLAVFAAIINWIAHRDNEIPYGPFLSGATVLLLLTWPVSWPFAKRFFDMGPILILMILFMLILLFVSLQIVQLLKRMLGINMGVDGDDDWSSADHLLFYGQERPDEQTGQWSVDQWPGSRSGRGLLQQHNWHRDR